jgi:pyridoxal phosphate enzyme (YggS family)
MSVAENIARVRERIQAAAMRAGRDADDITLMAVSKTFPAHSIREAYGAGIRQFGENRVQEFAGKVKDLDDLGEARWHMIGHLQSNKATKASELFHAVDSVDSFKLAEKLNEAAIKANKTLAVLIEINVGGEEAKTGVAPGSPELDHLLSAARQLERLQVKGLMTIPPFFDDPKATRSYFRTLRELRDQIAARNLPGIEMAALSMGMSHDFEVAIQEGSTCVRVGTAIFGERSRKL